MNFVLTIWYVNFLEKLKAEIVETNFLWNHKVDRFPESLGEFSAEQVERFHEDINSMEHFNFQEFEGKWDSCMIADYCWSILKRLQARY